MGAKAPAIPPITTRRITAITTIAAIFLFVGKPFISSIRFGFASPLAILTSL
ncbi:hypothetical protein [uncultured Methanobrevibacter sp.]|uniref:hypothetical protein n=1 Tax=uncultured Methanobrevibacter sp. TaxID=253161 RepID=UPI0025F6145D|nr:hypothetical protein [uncultured Methanobrevibacter sp.]